MWYKIFYRSRFQKLAAIYGSRIELWPQFERAMAHDFVARCPSKALKDLNEHKKLDDALVALRLTHLSDDSLWQSLSLIIDPLPLNANVFDFNGAKEPVPIALPMNTISETAYSIREERLRAVAKPRRRLKFS